MALCRVADVRDLAAPEAYAGAWLLAILLGATVAFAMRRRPGWAWFGAAWVLLSWPAWDVLLAVAPDVARTFCAHGDITVLFPPGAYVPPQPGPILSGQYIRMLWPDLAFLAAGGLALARARTGPPAPRGRICVPDVAHALRGLLPMGRGEWPSLRLGLAAFPLLAAANVALLLATSSTGLRTGDDSGFFAHASPLHLVMIPLAAAFAEELLYRGVMQQGLARALRVLPRPAALGTAMLVQAVVFAYAHAGYQNLQHLVFALLFALAAGIVAQVWGIWCAIALHALIDFYAIGLSIVEEAGWAALAGARWVEGLMLAAASVGIVWVAAGRTIKRLRRLPS